MEGGANLKYLRLSFKHQSLEPECPAHQGVGKALYIEAVNS